MPTVNELHVKCGSEIASTAFGNSTSVSCSVCQRLAMCSIARRISTVMGNISKLQTTVTSAVAVVINGPRHRLLYRFP